MLNLFRQWFTARDKVTYSLTKLIGIGAGIEMMVKFYQVTAPDYVGFGTGIAAIMAALAIKYYVEGDKNASKDN